MAIHQIMRKLLGAAVLATLSLGATQADAYSFSCLSDNSATDCGIAETQMGLTVGVSGGGLVFTFNNTGGAAATLTDIYFDWQGAAQLGPTATIAYSGSGINFDWGTNPNNLPAWKELEPDFSVNLSAGATSPSPDLGVNPGEWVSFTWFSSGYSYDEVLTDLLSGELRIGIKVQSFDSGGSESLVAVAAPVPEPGAMALMLAGGVMVGAFVRRRRQA